MPIPELRTSAKNSHQMFIENLLSTWDGAHAGDPEINTPGKAPALVGVYSSRASGAKARE